MHAVTHNALVCLIVELHFHCVGITRSQDGKMMCLPLAEMLNKFVKKIRITAISELHLLSWFWRSSINHNSPMSCGRSSIGMHAWYFAKKVSTKITNVREQFTMAHELFMNLYIH